jgi:hypothetical protein
MALHSEADIIGYGGAAGGGKTDLLIGAALLMHYRSIIFRRQAEQLRDIIERSKEIIGSSGRLNENYKIWRDLPGGRRLEFGGMKNEHDVNRYRGRAHDLKAFDELTEFSEMQFRTIIAWNRSAEGHRCRTIAAFNPPTSQYGMWVIKFFGPWIDPAYKGVRAKPGELRYFAMVDGKEIERPGPDAFEHGGRIIQPKSRTFIPARLEDNPALLASGYAATLDALPEPLATALRTGSFIMAHGADPWAVIPRAWAEAARRRGIERGNPTGPISMLGVDVARGGDDETVIARRRGTAFDPLLVWPGKETPDGPSVATLVIQQMESPEDPITVDGIGVGGSVVDQLAAIDGIRITAAIASMRSDPTARDRRGMLSFKNDRAMWWWRFREALDPNHGDEIALPDDDALIEELCAPRFMVRSGTIQIEEKDDIKMRLGRSPNRADALLLAHQESASLMLW